MVSIVGLGFDRFRNHPLKQDLKSHRVRATVMRNKEFAVAAIYTVIKSHVVIIIVTMKGKIKFVEEETISLLSVAPGFLSLANHSVVHFLSPFRIEIKKSTRRDACFPAKFLFLCRYLFA